MSDEIRTPAEALEAAARECDLCPDQHWGPWLANRVRALAARIPERDDEALVEDMCFEGGRAAPNADANDVVAIVEAVIAALREAGALK